MCCLKIVPARRTFAWSGKEATPKQKGGPAMNATLDQGTKILTIFKDTPREQVQEILESGVLADVRDGNYAGFTPEKRGAIRKLPGIKTLTSELIKARNFNWMNDNVTDRRSPSPTVCGAITNCLILEKLFPLKR